MHFPQGLNKSAITLTRRAKMILTRGRMLSHLVMLLAAERSSKIGQ
jgi:hypothetical protein